jgi:RND superfamily putative drug exporter
MLTRLAEFVIRRRRWVLVGSLLLFLGAGALGGNVQEHLSQGGFEDPNAESTKADEALLDRFGTGQPNFLLLVEAKQGNVDDPAVAAAGAALTAELAEEPNIEQAVSYWTLGSAPPLRSKDASKALVLATIKGTQDEQAHRVETLSPRWDGKDTELLDVRVGGFNEAFRVVGETIERDLTRAESVAFPITLILLIFVFGSVVAASLPLAIGALAVVGAFLILRIVASMTEVSVYSTSLVTAMGLGLAIDYSLFIVSRYREELAKGLDTRAAVVRSVQTAGRTVAFGGLTVAIALSVLLVFPLAFLRSFAWAGMGVVAFAVFGAVVVLPAILAALGPRIEKLSVGRRRKAATDTEGFWHRAALVVMRRPIPVATVVILVLLFLGAPFLNATFGLPDERVLPKGAPVRQVHDEIRREFDTNEAGAVSVVAADLGDPTPRMEEIAAYAVTLSQTPGAGRVDSLAGSYVRGQQVLGPNPIFASRFARPDGTWLSVVPTVEPNSPAGERLVKDLRDVERPFPVQFTGPSAQLVDSKASLFGRLPLAIGLIILTTFVMLFLMFGSLLVPVKAVVLNLLSLTATFGAMVWIFQDGHWSGFMNFTATGTLDTTTPILMFCTAFGLSMDYEVFLLSRIKEEHDHGSDNISSVAVGLERTGRIVTAAAATLAVVFIAFGTSDITFIKLFGVGLTMAVLMDATLIRAALVPAFMRLAGNANWWAPPFMRRIYERWGIHELPDERIIDLTDGYKQKLLELADGATSEEELHALLEVEGITVADLERWREPVGSPS